MRLRGPRHPALRGLVRELWVGAGADRAWERVVPSGSAHVAWRMGEPLEIADLPRLRYGVLGGPRSRAHLRRTAPVGSVGAVLAVGAIPRLFGMPASAAREQHVGLDALWGPAARVLQEELESLVGDPDAALDRVELALVARLRPPDAPSALPLALAALDAGLSVEAAALRSGRTTRRLGDWFARDVGLSPSRWARVRRVQRAMALAATEPDGSTLAHLAGYCDHAHLCRDFRDIAGVTLGAWRGHRPGAPAHVPVASDPSKPGGPRSE